MAAYLWGLATLPMIGAASVVLSMCLRGLVAALARVVARVGRTPDRNRALVAAVVYAAPRSWHLTLGDLGILVVVGQDPERRAEAQRLLNPPRSLKKINRIEDSTP